LLWRRSRRPLRSCCGPMRVMSARRDVVSNASSKHSRCCVPSGQCAR
jgi:hypothetical protein